MGFFDKITKAVSDSAVSAGTGAMRMAERKKCELALADIDAKYNSAYIIIGKRIAEFMRTGEEMNDPKVKAAFSEIVKMDAEKSELEAKLRELKGESADSNLASDMVAMEEAIELEISKCQELLDLGVDSQEEYDRKVAALRNKVKNFKQIRALDQALAKNLLTIDEYNRKKASLLSQDIVE